MSSPKVISGCAWIALSTRFRSSSDSFGLRPQLPVRGSTLPVSRICAASLYTSRSLTPYACAIILASWVRSYPLTSRSRVSMLNILFHLGLMIPLLPAVCESFFADCSKSLPTRQAFRDGHSWNIIPHTAPRAIKTTGCSFLNLMTAARNAANSASAGRFSHSARLAAPGWNSVSW